uniref:Homing endonuclease LAGLIDADG domain-containing protein n=1 Tax=Orbilia brochopaga TaxID=3140254 RepID=A0A481ZMJ3_9PEZI|nr:hypothetical protein [Drechslerella brochopaga]QBL02522.1 hypothetical protein [Drechslerella brochopaga]
MVPARQEGLIIYNLVEVVRLMNVLIIKYRLECKLRLHTPTQPRIYINQHSMPLLRKLVTPYKAKSMLYKIEELIKIQLKKGFFMVLFQKNSISRTGWKVWARFTISLHVKDINLLQQIKSYFGGG